MRTTIRILAAITVALFGLSFWVPVLHFTDQRFRSEDISLISAATLTETSPLVFGGMLAAALLLVSALTGVLPRTSGWIGAAGCLCVVGAVVDVMSNLWKVSILWDGFTPEGLPTGGMITPDPWWGAALIAAATLTLAVASVLQLIAAHRDRRARHTPSSATAPPAPADEEETAL